ncbi:YfjI family protein [Morganella morganii]|uniref:YfjI family protein n=1 Tax=Morganella morganii TaxID=582 RepID=UPI0033155157
MLHNQNLANEEENELYLPYYEPTKRIFPRLKYGLYPNADFPDDLSSVIFELSSNVQAPCELIGSTIISAISLACQGLINIQYPDDRMKPCSLYNIVLAGSGERKSAIYSLVMKPFLDYEKKSNDEYNNQCKKYKANLLIWKAKEKVLLANFRKKISTNQNSDQEKYSLEHHLMNEPEKPKKIKLIYNDTTPEALKWGLHDNSPCAGLMSDEANIFFSGRAKNEPEFLNQLWDGLPYDVERRTTPGITVDARFTMLLMVQNSLFIKYYKKFGERAGGSGFLSRFLLTTVNSTQGNRVAIPGKPGNNELNKFHERINFFLSFMDSKKNETVTQLTLSKAACKHYYAFYNITERMNFNHRNDIIISILSKAPENAIRLAALLSYFEDDKSTEISEKIIIGAINIIVYYVNQAIHLLTEDVSTAVEDAGFVYDWLVNRQKSIRLNQHSCISKIYVQRYISRNHLRNKTRLDAAIKILVEQGLLCTKLQQNANGSVSTVICLPDDD